MHQSRLFDEKENDGAERRRWDEHAKLRKGKRETKIMIRFKASKEKRKMLQEEGKMVEVPGVDAADESVLDGREKLVMLLKGKESDRVMVIYSERKRTNNSIK